MRTSALVLGSLVLLACGGEILVVGSGGSGTTGTSAGGSGNTGSGANANTTSTTASGGSVPVDCLTAKAGDACATPGDWCAFFDASTGEHCEAWCLDHKQWDKYCYDEPTYCYQPPGLCPTQLPQDGTPCASTEQCEYYDCEYFTACGGNGYAMASCQDGYWWTYSECFCVDPPGLCPTTLPQTGSPCTVSPECTSYQCLIPNACGDNQLYEAYCDFGTWWTPLECP